MNVALYVVHVLLALIFVMAADMKLSWQGMVSPDPAFYLSDIDERRK